ncbi:NifB/NifX family molybdenum-iron cluster-binding protein [Desulfocurvus sp. DL9XJH121]
MKLAIPTKVDANGAHVVDSHFGHCEFYTLLTVEDGLVSVEEHLSAPQGCGCKSNIASTLAEEGVSLLLAGNMGQGAVDKLKEAGIETVRGMSGPVRGALDSWLAGDIPAQPDICEHHGDDGHECGSHALEELQTRR